MSCRALRWLPIQLAPEDCDLEVGELDKTGIMPLGFPCRRKLGGGTMLGPMSRF
jgi:hypothetical protein